MNSFYFPLALTIGGMVLYHLSQKSIPSHMDPYHGTMLAYATGIVVCAFVTLTYAGNRSFATSLKGANWAVYAMGIGAAAIEVGFMLAYRYGWRISVTAVVTNVAVTAILIPLGVLLFREQISVRNILGVVFCVIGLFLVIRD
jgi:uncharacterized membrane protein YdcZ (DUF606 family)